MKENKELAVSSGTLPVQTLPRYTYTDLQSMAMVAVKSNMFGMKSYEQALSLMLLCESEGIHPMRAVREYDIIDGKPSLKAQAMLARFQRAGGKVAWHERTELNASATFSHPVGGENTISYGLEDAKRAKLTGKDNYLKNPRQMFTARVITEGVRLTWPDCLGGAYTPEENQEVANCEAAKAVETEIPAEILDEVNSAKNKGELAVACKAAKNMLTPKQLEQLTIEYRRRERELEEAGKPTPSEAEIKDTGANDDA